VVVFREIMHPVQHLHLPSRYACQRTGRTSVHTDTDMLKTLQSAQCVISLGRLSSIGVDGPREIQEGGM
jgi:hypothetical protein